MPASSTSPTSAAGDRSQRLAQCTDEQAASLNLTSLSVRDVSGRLRGTADEARALVEKPAARA